MTERRILVVEDNPVDVEFIEMMLKTARHGPFAVTAVDRLAAALTALGQESYEVVLLDLGLPDSVGLASLQAVCAAQPGIAVVVLTGSRDESLVEAALSNGAQDYIKKSELEAELLNRVLRYSVQRARADQALREQGRQLAEAQRLAQVGSWQFDLTAGRMTWSDETFRVLGYQPGGVEPGADALLARVHPEDRVMVESYVDDPRRFPRSGPVTYRVVHDDGEIRWVESRVALIHDDEGGLRLARGTTQDVTARRQAEEDRRRAREKELEIQKLKEVDQLKTLFLNTASHELNNPITPLKVQAHLLLKGAFGTLHEGQRGAVEVMSRSIARLEALARDVLDTTRIQSGRLKTRVEPTNLGTLVRDTYRNQAAKAQEHGVTLTAEAPRRVIADVDPVRVAQVLSNLVDNAVKFTPHGGMVSVTMNVEAKEVHIQVQDTGAGLSSDQIAQLFQPFSQVHEYQRGRPQGTGLGLFISKGIAEQMGGRLWVESQGPETGSTFHLAFPLSSPGGEPASCGQSRSESVSSVAAPLRKNR